MRTAALICGGILALAGCGEDEDFANDPRPPKEIQITGVITDDKVTVSPAELGAGPVVLTLSNQSKDAHTITLEGGTTRARIGPIGPLETGTIKKTLDEGDYEVKAGSERAVAEEIAPATLAIGAPRPSSSNDTLLP